MSHPSFIMCAMGMNDLGAAIELLEKSNANLEPELLAVTDARRLLADYARVEKLAAFGVAALAQARRCDGCGARHRIAAR